MREQVPDRTPVGFRYLGIADDPATLTDYHAAWQLQREVHAEVAAGELGPQVLYVEHPPVYTAGRRTEPHERPLIIRHKSQPKRRRQVLQSPLQF